jgi:hypothetical protein
MWVENTVVNYGNINEIQPVLTNFENLLKANDWYKPHLRPKDRELRECSIIYNKTDLNRYIDLDRDYDEQDEAIEAASHEIINYCINKFFKGYKLIKGEISTLVPGAAQEYHIDPRIFHRFSKRVCIPIITNDQCNFHTYNMTTYMEKYGVYEINNIINHRSSNYGEENRTYIVIDIMKQNFFNYITSRESADKLFRLLKVSERNSLKQPEKLLLEWSKTRNPLISYFDLVVRP